MKCGPMNLALSPRPPLPFSILHNNTAHPHWPSDERHATLNERHILTDRSSVVFGSLGSPAFPPLVSRNVRVLTYMAHTKRTGSIVLSCVLLATCSPALFISGLSYGAYTTTPGMKTTSATTTITRSRGRVSGSDRATSRAARLLRRRAALPPPVSNNTAAVVTPLLRTMSSADRILAAGTRAAPPLHPTLAAAAAAAAGRPLAAALVTTGAEVAAVHPPR